MDSPQKKAPYKFAFWYFSIARLKIVKQSQISNKFIQ